MTSELAKRVVLGMLGGMNGAGSMTALRLVARRLGAIDRTPPEMLEGRLLARNVTPDASVVHHVADHALHFAIGVIGGGVYGALARGRSGQVVAGAAFGLALWAVSFFGVMPLVGATRTPHRSQLRENALNIAAHVLYGALIALTTSQLAGQRRGSVLRELHPRFFRVG